MYNILIGGAAGQGIETTVAMLQKLLKNSGYYVFTMRDFMSRVRGGHNFSIIRFGTEPVYSHSLQLDGIVAFNQETIDLHSKELKEKGFILCDKKYSSKVPGVVKADMAAAAKELGNPKVIGSIAAGAVIKLFDGEPEKIDQVLKEYVKEKYYEINKKAFLQGYEMVEKKFPNLAKASGPALILSGNQALAFGAIAAGMKFYSAYPMSPSTSIMEYLASKSREAGFVVEQAEDEIAAINMAIGASFAGAPAMTGTSGGGFSLKVEALGLSGMAEIPLVVVDVQRPGPATGLPTRTEQSDLKFVISASQGEFPRMVIALRNHSDAFYQTARAFALADKYQLPVILLSDQYLGDAFATVEPFDLSKITTVDPLQAPEIKEGEYNRYQLTKDSISPRLIPGKTMNFVTADSDEHDEFGRITEASRMRTDMMDKRMGKLEGLKKELMEPEFLGSEDFDILFLGWGSTYGAIHEAVELLNRKKGPRYAALVFGDIYPLPQKLLKEKAETAKKLINIEQNATGQLASLIREQTGIVCTGSILKYDGRQISAEEIISRMIEEVSE